MGSLFKKIKIEIACSKDFVEPAIGALIKGVRTGEVGNGAILVLDLHEVVRIRTGERGNTTIG